MIEFAYTMPIVVAVFGGGTELANIALTHSRLSQIAAMTGDNAARVIQRIDETDIDEIMEGTRRAGDSINFFSKGRVIISSIEDRPDTADANDQKIVWQRCKGMKATTSSAGVEGTTLDDPVGNGTARSIQAMPNNPIILVEVSYTYEPLFPIFSFGVTNISYQSAYTVRDRADNTMQNGTGMPNSSKALCSTFSNR